MKNLITTSCVALLAIASAAPSFAETRSAPGEWRPDNAAALEQQYDCDPNEWTRAISDDTGETLYSNNWTCQPGRASERGSGDRCRYPHVYDGPGDFPPFDDQTDVNKAINKYAQEEKPEILVTIKCYPKLR